MEFNNIWTKEVNDQYRQMIKDGKSPKYILEHFGGIIHFNPNGKYKHSIPSYNNYMNLINEIKMNPNYIHFSYDYIDSVRYKDLNDIRCFFQINDIDYILILETFIENNEIFKNKIVYNIVFTTKKQYDLYIKELERILRDKKNVNDEDFNILKDIFEEETNHGDIIKIFNAISYILLNMSKKFKNPIFLISDTDDYRKIKFYKKSIEDSFDNYDMIIGKSDFFPNGNTYYYIIKNE